MTPLRKAPLFVFLAACGLGFYVWSALAAPVVLWSDSHVDMDWARRGVGLWQAPPRGGHPAKPGYLLFLRAAMAIPLPEGSARAVVVTQSILLWASIAGTAFYLGRKWGVAGGVSLYALLILFLRLRDTSSAIMTEALGAALFLPLVVLLLEPPGKLRGGFFLWGLGAALLFWVRPNMGVAALCLAAVRLGLEKRGTALLLAASGFLALGLPVWLATRQATGEVPLGGLSYPLLEATADYYWRPSLEPWPRSDSPEGRSRAEFSKAFENWKITVSRAGPDARRETLWRALHGLFGIEYYDARWSSIYRRLTTLSRTASPFLLAASLAFLIALPFRGPQRGIGFMGLFLPALLVGHDVVLGANPRYILPFLPGVLLLGIAGALALKGKGALRLFPPILFAAIMALLASQRDLLDWQWGMIEAPGVRLVQPVPRGAFPSKEPATLHIRIAPVLLPTNAHLLVRGPGGRVLYSSTTDPSRGMPFLSLPLPAWILEMNQRSPVRLELLSQGDYGTTQYLLFPVVPRPWSALAWREESPELSPATGVAEGSLDWWAHPGRP